MIDQIKTILETELPKGFNIIVSPYKSFYGSEHIKIMFSPNVEEINRVRGQFPQVVSLSLAVDKMELEGQIYGGNGGLCIYREIDPNHPKEKYLAMKSVKVPFRKPKKEGKFVLAAIKRFAQNYLKTLKDNREVLRYQDLVDYSFLD